MRADRLITIVQILQSRGKISSKELAQTLEVSERTIFRDMEALSFSGIPVLAERGREGGWRLAEGYRNSLTGMNTKEIAALLVPADPAILHALGIQEEFSSAARKLQAVATRQPVTPFSFLSQRIHIDGAGWHPSGETYPCLTALQGALWENRKVSITYLRGEDAAERLVAPLGLVVKRGVWYLVAGHDSELRTYRVSRITEAKVTDELFELPEDFDLSRYWETSTAAFKSALPRYPSSLLVREQTMKELQKERYVALLHKEPSEAPGWIRAEVEFNTPESACRIILSLGQGIKVTAPPELADTVAAALREAAALYDF
ncbi:YafY family protein [Paenibacillus sp. FSL H8-0122]|uniref:helix-turn-helix transcriptional regulator n=1 Tax=Paenibacillus sp. FSL H8-0122 TaxID=2954510 RepID=UPI0030FB5B0E